MAKSVTVNPACAGMIRPASGRARRGRRKPRVCGDDPMDLMPSSRPRM